MRDAGGSLKKIDYVETTVQVFLKGHHTAERFDDVFLIERDASVLTLYYHFSEEISSTEFPLSGIDYYRKIFEPIYREEEED